MYVCVYAPLLLGTRVWSASILPHCCSCRSPVGMLGHMLGALLWPSSLLTISAPLLPLPATACFACCVVCLCLQDQLSLECRDMHQS